MIERILFFLIICFLVPLKSLAQQDSLIQIPEKNVKILPLPMFWYTPETRFGFGVAAMVSFRFDKNNPNERVSSFQIGEAYTQEKQWINFSSFQIFPWKEKLFIYGEAGYYKYRYYFFGTGNNNPPEKNENFDINFSRIRINILYKVLPHFYSGIRYWYENSSAGSKDSSGYLLNGFYNGFPKAVTSSPGFVLLYDNRDHLFFPTKGWFAELSFQKDASFTGSQFNFSRFTVDAARYFPLLKKHVLACNFVMAATNGNVPFTLLPMIGGNKKMRGYYEGRYRDQWMMLLQAEFRMQIFKRWFINVYGSAGNVSENLSSMQIKHIRFSGGIGLRFRIDTKNKINLRLDSAFGRDGLKNYFTFNEAF